MTPEGRSVDPSDLARGVRPVVLVIDDDAGLRESFHLILDDDFEVIGVADGPRALEVVRSRHVDLVLLDIRLPDMDGIEVLERIKGVDETVEVVLVTAVRTVRTAVAAMKLGAFDYLTKPFEEEELLAVIRRALEKRSLEREVTFLRSELERHHDFDELVGQHPEMQRLYRLIGQVARTSTTVLITGESGTGKEVVARAIHRQSSRRQRPFVPVNAAAITETLVESELFGHELPSVWGDHETLYRVAVNLVTNAVEAMSGGGRLTLRVAWNDEADRPRAGGRQRVRLEVQDSGVGIAPAHADQVFNPFFSTKPQGTGLGLALAHKLVQDHGGTIDFQSRPGVGTTFRVVLPLVPDVPPTDPEADDDGR